MTLARITDMMTRTAATFPDANLLEYIWHHMDINTPV